MSALSDANAPAVVRSTDAVSGQTEACRRAPLRRWLVAILAATLATAVRHALQPVLQDSVTFVFAYPTIVLIALRQGFGPAMLTAVLCGAGAALAVLAVGGSLVELPVRLGLFGMASIVIALACSQSGEARRRATGVASPVTDGVDTPLTRWLQAVIWGAALIPLTLFASACWWSYDTALTAGQDRVTRANLVTLRHAERTFQTATDVARQARSLTAQPDARLRESEPEIRQRLQDMLIGLSAVQAIMVWDANGQLVLGTAVTGRTPTPTVADRAYFQQARAASDEVFFTGPIKGRITGQMVLNAVARRTAPDGSFAGAVVVALYPSYFQQFYQSLASEETGLNTFAMFRTDGEILARWPPPPPGMRLPDSSQLAKSVGAGRTDGVVRVRSQIDGMPRMISFMRVRGTPVYASAALLESSIMEPWHRFMLLLAAVLGPVTVGLVYVSWVALKKTRREQVVLLELQAEMRRRAQTEKALAQAQRLEALSVLTGGVAHDFNNLLAIVNGNIHMIRRLHADVGHGRHLNAIARAVASGVRLTRQLLSFARRQALKPEDIALQSWLPGMADLLKSTLGNGIALEIEVAPDVAPIYVDAGELELALINLATNARHAMTQRGSLHITASNTVGGDDRRAMAVIRVHDTGCGIAPELLSKVFEPFFTTKPPNEGTGLGLSQVYGFCLQAGGAASVESVPGRGTTVSMMFPAAQRQAKASPAEPGARAAERLSGAVLLVEHNAEVAAAHRDMLESAGLRVTVVGSSDEALLAAEGLGPGPHLVLSDIAMPGPVDGIQLALRLRELRPGLPVILLTGYAPRVQEAAEAGFRVLGKPVEAEHLIEVVGDALLGARAVHDGVVRHPAAAPGVAATVVERA